MGVGVLCALAAELLGSCGEEETRSPEIGPLDPAFIRALANNDRTVEEIDVCAAIRIADVEDTLATLMDTDTVDLNGGFVEAEDAWTQVCDVTTAEGQNEDVSLSIKFMQGTEFKVAREKDRQVYPGCRLYSRAPDPEIAAVATIRVTCGYILVIDLSLEHPGDTWAPTWTNGPDSKPSPVYVDLLHAVIEAVSRQG